MTESGYADETRLIPRRARGYVADGGQLVNAPAFNMVVPGGAGALGSTASDLLKWARALPALEVVGDASFALMTTPTTIEGGIKIDYGLGLALGHADGAPWFGHGGNIEGFNTWIEWLPEQDAAIVVLVNTEGEQAEALGRRIARLLLPEPTANAGASGANGATAVAATPPVPLDAARATACLGKYRSRGVELEIVANADGSLAAKLGPQQTAPLVFRGETAGRLDFEIDARQRLHVEPDAKPPRATLVRPTAAQRFERS
jgi:CubicO group peptidase (beta-lactamase class C family)